MRSVLDIIDEIGHDGFLDLVGIVSQYLSNAFTNPTVTGCCAGILYFYSLWDLNKITKRPEDLEKYSKNRETIIELFTALIAKPDTENELKYKTFKYLCEILMVVSSQAAFGSPLHYEVTTDIWTTIEEYILNKPVLSVDSVIPIPAKAFYKYGAKDEQIKEDADEVSQTTCLLVARIISFCPSLTTSHLTSSFFAHFGTSNLRSINLIVKQVIVHYKTKESQQSGVFNDSSLFFTIVLESMIKAMGSGTDEEIADMRDLAKKFSQVMGSGPMRPKQADKFLSFVLDGISFAFSDRNNFQILEGLQIFLLKNFLSPNQMKELYDRICKDAETIENKIKEHEGDIAFTMYPIRHFLYCLGKIVGIARQPPVLPSEKTKRQINRRRQELYRRRDEEYEKERVYYVAVKKSAVNISDEFIAIKKSAIVDFGFNVAKSSKNKVAVDGRYHLPRKRNSQVSKGVGKPVKKSTILNENME